MHKFTLVFGLIALGGTTSDDILVESSFEANGHDYKYAITRRMIDDEPAWRNSDNPPLACLTAIKKAQAYLKDTLAIHGVEVTSISLQKVPFLEIHDKWYYIVTFENPVLSNGPSLSIQLYVLMNGQVVGPKN